MRHCWRSTNDEVNQSFPFSEVSFLDLECHDGGPPGVSVGSLGLTCGWRTGSGNWIGTCTDCICWDRRTRSLLSLRLCQHHCLGGSRTVTSDILHVDIILLFFSLCIVGTLSFEHFGKHTD